MKVQPLPTITDFSTIFYQVVFILFQNKVICMHVIYTHKVSCTAQLLMPICINDLLCNYIRTLLQMAIVQHTFELDIGRLIFSLWLIIIVYLFVVIKLLSFRPYTLFKFWQIMKKIYLLSIVAIIICN